MNVGKSKTNTLRSPTNSTTIIGYEEVEFVDNLARRYSAKSNNDFRIGEAN